MEPTIGRDQSGERKQRGKHLNNNKNFKIVFVQIAFFVKHEAVGGQGEVLARCVFQIPDIVAACRWAKYSRNWSTSTMTTHKIPSNLVLF